MTTDEMFDIESSLRQAVCQARVAPALKLRVVQAALQAQRHRRRRRMLGLVSSGVIGCLAWFGWGLFLNGVENPRDSGGGQLREPGLYEPLVYDRNSRYREAGQPGVSAVNGLPSEPLGGSAVVVNDGSGIFTSRSASNRSAGDSVEWNAVEEFCHGRREDSRRLNGIFRG